MHWETKKICVTRFTVITHFIAVVWGRTHNVSEACLCTCESCGFLSVLPVCGFSLRWVFSAARERAVRGRRVRWLLSLQSSGSGARRLHSLWPRAQVPCGMWTPAGHFATREVPVFQKVPEVPHEAVMKPVLIRQNHEYLLPPED